MFNRLYVDDIFALFSFPDHADKFKEYLSTGHPSIISVEKKKDGCLPFSGFKIFSENEKLPTNVYRKIPFSGVYPSFKRFILKLKKWVLFKSSLFRCFSLSAEFIKFYHETDKLKSIF